MLFAYPGACSTILPKMHCKQGEKDRERVRELVGKACMVDEHSKSKNRNFKINESKIDIRERVVECRRVW